MEPQIHNIIIIGSGPAGYSAGLYAARANLNPLLFTGIQPGGQLTTTTSVENYLGLDEKNGYELTEIFKNHAVKYGVQLIDAQVISIHKYMDSDQLVYQLTDSNQQTYLTYTIVIATGASAKRLHLPSEEKYWNHGISACAVCDGALPIFRKKPLAVIGGGDSACEEALFLSRFGSVVYLIHRGNSLRASKIMQDRVRANPKIQIIFNTQVLDVYGQEEDLEHLGAIKCIQLNPHKEYKMEICGLFYGIGHVPNTEFLKKSPLKIELDDHGYIVLTNKTETSCPGIFACGDVCDKIYRQAITSAGTGCMCALDASEYLSNHIGKN